MDNALKKEIDIQQKFANAVNVVYREKKLGITPCCFSDLVSASIDKYLCDWENTKKYISNIIDTYEVLDACESIKKKNSESSNIVNSSNSEYISKSASAREEEPAEVAASYYYYGDEEYGIGSSNLELGNDGLPILNNSNIKDAVEAYMNGLLQDIENWDVSNVDSMSRLFALSGFNQDISNWDVSNVTNMEQMFMGATTFNQDIGNWDVGSVNNMEFMFFDAIEFEQDISSWDISSLANTRSFMERIDLSISNYDALLIGWEATLQAAYPSGSGYTFNPNINFGTSTHTTGGSAEAAKNSLISTFNWTITDGNP